jgi:hypothetical protein
MADKRKNSAGCLHLKDRIWRVVRDVFLYCLLPIAYCLLPIACCLLPIAYCLLPINDAAVLAHVLPAPVLAVGRAAVLAPALLAPVLAAGCADFFAKKAKHSIPFYVVAVAFRPLSIVL